MIKLSTHDIDNFWSKVSTQGSDDCWPWIAKSKIGGYGRFYIKRVGHAAHRVAFTIGNGEIPTGLLVCHRCDNRVCCNPKHLFIGTYQDNHDDMDRKGRRVLPTHYTGDAHWARKHPEWIARGTRQPRAKLNEKKVRQIRKLYANGMRELHIARKFGVTHTTVRYVRTGKSWKHVK